MNFKKLSDSPFIKDKNNPEVFVAKGNDAYKNTIDALSNIDLAIVKGKKVLLKPNAGRMAEIGSGINTNPLVVAAAIDAFQKAGADVSIGESPITGAKTHEVYEITGIKKVANERNCPLIDMDENPFVPIDFPEGIATKSFKVCPEVYDFDIIVSIPVIKMHMHTGVTLAIKNMKGCLWRRSKVKLHMLPAVEGYDDKPLDIAISDMSYILKPHLSIIDGSIGMEGMGPSAGKAKEIGVVVVSADPYSADAVACRLIGTSAEEIPHLRIGASRGYGIIDMDKINVYPKEWKDWKVQFAKPPKDISVEYDNVTILDKNSCSACQSTLMLFLKKYSKSLFDYFSDEDEIYIAIGKGHDDVPDNTLCIGNCTIMHKDKGIFVKGCPPVGSEILKKISDTYYKE